MYNVKSISISISLLDRFKPLHPNLFNTHSAIFVISGVKYY